MRANLNRANLPSPMSNVVGLNATSALTFAFWHRKMFSGTGSIDIFQHRGPTSARDGYMIGFSATELQLRLYGDVGSTNSFINQRQSLHQSRKWHHYVIRFDNATNEVLFFVDGKHAGRSTNTRNLTANPTTTFTWCGFAGVMGSAPNAVFDIQVFPNYLVPVAEIPLLMNPFYADPNCKGRYAGARGGGTALMDESGAGNHLSNHVPIWDQPPPLLPTFQ